MPYSGINGGNCLLSSMATLRIKNGMLNGARIKGNKGHYNVFFLGDSGDWEGEPLVLSSARSPYNGRIFKSIDGAMSAIHRIGLNKAIIEIIE